MNDAYAHRIAKICVACNSASIRKNPAVLMPFIAERVFGWTPVEITQDWGLRDIKAGQAYSVCNTLTCDDCGLIFLDIRFDDTEMAALYCGYRGDEYNALRDKYEPGYTANNTWRRDAGFAHIPAVETYIKRHISAPTRVLDWGGDTGINTPFKGQLATHHVFDISSKLLVDGATRVSADEAAGNEYDLVTLMHVLEHVPYPQRTLKEIAAMMGKATVLYIELPYEELVRINAESPGLARQQKRHWHEHINFFSREAIVRLLKTCGLRAVDISTEQGFIYSVLCRLGH